MNKKMKNLILVLLFFTSQFFAINQFKSPNVVGAEPTLEDIAYYWAPAWYHSIDNTSREADYICAFNYDDNWIGNDNWENLLNYTQKAVIYYSIVETETNWFIGYYVYHPRDWSEILILQHEHDFEGVLVVVKRGVGQYGEFLCMITESHFQLYQYADLDNYPSNSLVSGYENIDGDVEFEYISGYNITLPFGGHDHPIAYIEHHGHGIHGADRWEDIGFPGDDGLIFLPLGLTGTPNNRTSKYVSYSLVDIDVFWKLRGGPFGDGQTLGNFKAFDGDTHEIDSGTLPWGWDDPDDGPTFAGEIFYDPAALFDTYFDNLGEFSHNYTYNPYCMQITLDSYKINWNLDGGGDKSDCYLNLYLMDGSGKYDHFPWKDGVLDGDSGSQYSWIGWDKETEIWIDMHEEIPRSFYSLQYPDKPLFGIRSKEWDDVTSDQWLMVNKETQWYGIKGTSKFEGSKVHPIEVGQIYLNWEGSELYLTVNLTVHSMLPNPGGKHPVFGYYIGGAEIITIAIVITYEIRQRRKYKAKWRVRKVKSKTKSSNGFY